MRFIEVHYDELDPHERRMALLVAALGDLRPFWPRVSRIAIGWISRQFDTEGRFFGDPWEPLSPAYLAAKTRIYPNKKILSAEGDLRRAATTPRRRATATTLELTIGTYEKRHERRRTLSGKRERLSIASRGRANPIMEPSWFQDGTGRMPARPLISDPSAMALSELDREGDAYIEELLRTFSLL